MNIQQVKQIIHWCAAFHDSLGQQYRKLAQDASDPRLKMTLDYLAQHEREMQGGLNRFLETAPADVLNTYFRQVPDLEQPAVLESLRSCLCCASIDDAERADAEFHAHLRSMYQQLADLSETGPVLELFESLARNEDEETRRVARAIASSSTL